MGRGKFKGKPTGRRQFSTHEEMLAGTSTRSRTFRKKRKGTEGVIHIENPNLVKPKNLKAKNLDMEKTTELSMPRTTLMKKIVEGIAAAKAQGGAVKNKEASNKCPIPRCLRFSPPYFQPDAPFVLDMTTLMKKTIVKGIAAANAQGGAVKNKGASALDHECPIPRCLLSFTDNQGLVLHLNTQHVAVEEPEEEERSEEESEEESDEENEKRKGTEGVIQIDNPNLVKPKNLKAKNLDMEKTTELSRREREEIEKQQAHERYMRLQEQGKTEQARKDLDRLALIRQQRAEAA